MNAYNLIHTQPHEWMSPDGASAGTKAADPLWECAACGAVVRNQVVHDEWHADLVNVLKAASL